MSYKRALFIVLGILVVLVVVGGLLGAIYGPPWTREKAMESFPQIEGEIQLDGLDAQAEIFRDSNGIPHIYASTEHDLFFAQGYVQAQDRFWQMDLWRHQGAGRLSELLGKATIETDQFLRTLGWERIAQEELENLDDQSMALLTAYADGVNAYLADHTDTAISLEYAFLPILNRNYQPAPWQPIHTMTWAKAMAWDLRGNIDTELDRARLLSELSSEQVDFLYPPYPKDHPLIVNHPHVTSAVSPSTFNDPALAAAVSPAMEFVNQQFTMLDNILGGGFDGIGSNNWVISGDLTTTGKPLLVNDPHLGVQMPSIWYEIGLHCQPVSAECNVNVTGFSFAGAPGIIIGHNDKIAWGVTNTGPDVMDLYIEKINPENPDQYEFEGQWVDMTLVTEMINIAGSDPVEITAQITRHGPLITDVYGLEEFSEESGIDIPENYAISLRWTALEPSCAFCAFWGMDKAQNWAEFRTAASRLAVPAQNLVYADVEGNIGYQTPGFIPMRSDSHDGMLPVPGWTGEYEWQGYIPFDKLPFAFNPPEGYIVTANNAVVGPEYPYSISRVWAYGYRAERIVNMIESLSEPISIADMQQIQGDNKDLLAEVLVPMLLKIPFEDAKLADALTLLQGWNYQMDIDSAPAALYAAFWKALVSATFHDQIPKDYWPSGGARWMEITRILLADPGSAWWDDQTTSRVETRDDIFIIALKDAVKEMRKLGDSDPANWAWGELHTTSFDNQVMSNLPFIKNAFNRGGFPTAGGQSIVNATGWDLLAGYEVDWLPSMRMIVDFSNFQNSLTVNTTGASGHAYHPHYIDLADDWRMIKYHPMHWDRAAIENDAEGHLRLMP